MAAAFDDRCSDSNSKPALPRKDPTTESQNSAIRSGPGISRIQWRFSTFHCTFAPAKSLCHGSLPRISELSDTSPPHIGSSTWTPDLPLKCHYYRQQNQSLIPFITSSLHYLSTTCTSILLSLNIMGKPVRSCDNCRRSRVGCNAISTLGQGCFNCVRKGVKCAFRPGATSGKGEKKAQAPQEGRVLQNGGQLPSPEPPFGDIHDSRDMGFEPSAEFDPSPSSSLPPPSLSNFSDSLAKSQQALRLHHLLWNVFTADLESRIGLWIGGAGCPFMTTSTVSSGIGKPYDAVLTIQAPTTLISSLMIDLDKSPASPRRNTVQDHKTSNGIESQSGDDGSINRALLYAIYAFSVRWLHPTDNKQNQDPETRSRFIALKKELSDNLWSEARNRMYAVMSRPSYRSILALYLFAIIPSSSRKGGDNIEDLCLEASLNQQNYLSSKAQMPSTHHDSIATLLGGGPFSSTKIAFAQANAPLNAEKIEYQSMANLALWFGIISDTTRALTRCRPSILLPGCNGEAKVWAAVREHTQAFEKQFSSLRGLRTPLLDDQVIGILQHAFAFSTLVWAAITRVQDALVYQISGTSAAEAVDAVRKESNKFEETFGKLLCLCQRDFMLLNRTTQMCYGKYLL